MIFIVSNSESSKNEIEAKKKIETIMNSTCESIEESKATQSNFKTALITFKSVFPLFLSHHPRCTHFKGHTLNVGRIKLCIGCFIGYPSALLGILLIYILDLRSIISLQAFLNIGILLTLFFFLSFTGLTKIKIVKIAQKFLIGIGASFLFWGIWDQPISFNERYFTFTFVFGFILSFLNLYHIYGFYSNCHNCEIPFGWYICEGFESIRVNFERNNINNIFKYFETFSKKIIQKKKIKLKKNL